MNSGLAAVLDNDYCIGCGGCVSATGGEMKLNEYGFYRPHFDEDRENWREDALEQACPFLAPELNEDALADRFLDDTAHRDHYLGKFDGLFAAHANEQGFRQSGSSGGMGSWIAVELLRLGLVDGIIHAGPVARNGPEDPYFRYKISRDIDELRAAAHSHYHVVEISEVLAQVKQTPGRYLFIGVPCMVKAMRRAQISDPVIARRILYAMALVCGHLKSVHWATSLGWAVGIAPEDISAITFRVKLEDIPAKAYYFGIENKETGKTTVYDSAPLTGGKFNLGAMMPEACNFCDDIVGETADITIGDAWLPRYASDWQGKNMIVSRNKSLGAMLQVAAKEGRICLDPITPKEAREAQAGGFRQRREGLTHRLRQARKLGHWTPVKRSLPDMMPPNFLRALIYEMRAAVSARSSDSFRKALDHKDLSLYDTMMRRSFKRLRRVELCFALFRVASLKLQTLLAGARP